MKRLTVVLGLFIFLFALGFFWWNNGLQPRDSSNHTYKLFVIPKGEGVREIANSLKSQGFIKDQVVFFLLTKKLGLDKQVEAGDYKISPSMDAASIAKALTHGTLDIWVTIPEGQRAQEIADDLKSIPTYKSDWGDKLQNDEGYLFPDTYLIPRDATVDTIISLLKNNFEQKYDSVKNLKTTNLTEAQTIIIASIIEREAVFEADRPLVASVLINRLNMGMALGADPTVMYALGYQKDTNTWWKKDLTADDLNIDSLYNTRKYAGLPPTPISNPGLSAIKAALAPTTTDYLYYYSDKAGHLHFAKTLEEHNANIKKYGP